MRVEAVMDGMDVVDGMDVMDGFGRGGGLAWRG